MSNYNDKIRSVMRRAEATGGLSGSALANEIRGILSRIIKVAMKPLN